MNTRFRTEEVLTNIVDTAIRNYGIYVECSQLTNKTYQRYKLVAVHSSTKHLTDRDDGWTLYWKQRPSSWHIVRTYPKIITQLNNLLKGEIHRLRSAPLDSPTDLTDVIPLIIKNE